MPVATEQNPGSFQAPIKEGEVGFRTLAGAMRDIISFTESRGLALSPPPLFFSVRDKGEDPDDWEILARDLTSQG